MKKRIASLFLAGMMAGLALMTGCSTAAPAPAASVEESVEEAVAEEASVEEVVQEEPEEEAFPQAQELAKRVVAAMEETKSVTNDTQLDMGFSVGVKESGMDFTLDMKMNMGMLLEVSEDPITSHAVMSFVIEAMGQEETSEVEMYIQDQEDGTALVFTKEGETWEKDVQDISEVQNQAGGQLYDTEILEELIDGNLEAEIEPNLVEKNGEECYHMTILIKGEDIPRVMNSMMGAEDELFNTENVDWSEADSTLELWIRTQDDRIAASEMDCTSIGELALLQAMDMAESQEDLEGVEVKINEFVIRTNFLDYDKGAVEIPEDLLAGESAAKSDADKEKAEAALTDALKSKENAEKAAGDLTEEEVLDMLSNMSDEELAEMLEGLSEEEIQELLDALQ